jgi:hypothetical protein
MATIRIQTRQGKHITRRAVVVDYIANNGRQFSAAQVGIHLYRIAYRDSTGPVWAVSKE